MDYRTHKGWNTSETSGRTKTGRKAYLRPRVLTPSSYFSRFPLLDHGVKKGKQGTVCSLDVASSCTFNYCDLNERNLIKELNLVNNA